MIDIRPLRFTAVATAALSLGLVGLSGCQKAAEDGAAEAVSTETSDDVLTEATAIDAAVADAASDATTTYADGETTVTAAVTPTAAYRITDGDRSYYYRRGEDAPYLVRRGEEYYSFKNGALDRVLDARGRELPDRRDAVRPEAKAWADRGRDLKDKAEPRLPRQARTQSDRTQPDRAPSPQTASGPSGRDRDPTGAKRPDVGTSPRPGQGAPPGTQNAGRQNPERAASRPASGRADTTSNELRTGPSRTTDDDETARTDERRSDQRRPIPPSE